MSNKTLTIVFVALLGLYLLTRLFSGRTEKTFRTELVQVDTAMVDKIELYPKAAGGQTVTLTRNNGQWMVSDGKITAPATASAAGSLLGQLTQMNAKRVVARQQEKWKDYEVEENTGSRVKAYQKNKVVADFIVGRFNFNQQTRQALSYVRLTDEPEVYAVDGFLSMTFGQDVNAFRNKQILKLDTGVEVNSLQLQEGGQTVSLQKMGNNWLLNGQQPIDSTKMAGYLSGLRFVAGNTFADGFTPGGNPEQSLLINTGASPITINAFRNPGGEKPYVIQSSQFPDAYFASDSSGIFSRLFVNLNDLVKGG